MSIIHTFDNASEEIIKPEYISSAGENFPKTLIATFRPQLVELLKARYETEEMGNMEAILPVPVHCFTYKGRRLGMYLTMLGGPASAGLMEEAAAMGGEKFLFFGSAGVLDRQLAAGRLIVPTAAYRDEGTSYHYLPPGDYVDIPTAGRLAEIFTELNPPHVPGDPEQHGKTPPVRLHRGGHGVRVPDGGGAVPEDSGLSVCVRGGQSGRGGVGRPDHADGGPCVGV